jgi:hypothetical protein
MRPLRRFLNRVVNLATRWAQDATRHEAARLHLRPQSVVANRPFH